MLTSRRAFLAALPAAGALVVLPAMAATDNLSFAEPVTAPPSLPADANLQRTSDATAKLAVASEPASGFAVMTIGKRCVTVDTAALPQLLRVVDEDSRTDAQPEGVPEFVSMPERGSEYVALTHDGRIVITKLERSFGSARKPEPRIGFMRGRWNGRRASYQVTVLGKVIGAG